MLKVVTFCCLSFWLGLCEISRSDIHRELYDLNIGGKIQDKVLTYSSMTDPVGIASGEYGGHHGLFVSSFRTHSIYFISTEDAGHSNSLVTPQRISGGSDSIDLDGSFGSASFAEPSRMVYDSTCKYLFVSSRRNMHIRVMRMQYHDVQTVMNEENSYLSLGVPSQFTEFPAMDIQSIEGTSLFVTNTKLLYHLTTMDGHHFCDNIIDSPVVTPYYSLSKYMEVNGYNPDTSRLTSVAPDKDRNCLYVAIADNKNVIVKVPMEATLAREYTSIIKLVGVEQHTWGGDTSLQTPPIARNGYAQSGNDVKVTFPMHVQYDAHHDDLYWTECFPFAGDFLLGSLAVRRMNLLSGM